jgi:hypothetical protein
MAQNRCAGKHPSRSRQSLPLEMKYPLHFQEFVRTLQRISPLTRVGHGSFVELLFPVHRVFPSADALGCVTNHPEHRPELPFTNRLGLRNISRLYWMNRRTEAFFANLF